MERLYGIDALLSYLNQQGVTELSDVDILHFIEKRTIPHFVSIGKRYSFQKDYIDSWLITYQKQKTLFPDQ